MNVDASMPDELLANEWKTIDWNAYQDKLQALQRELALVAKKRKASAISAIQWRIVESIEARALAVRRVCNRMSMPGVDHVVWRSDADKMRAACRLTTRGYRAKDLHLIKIIPKDQLKERHIHIPTYYDRAMQVLYAYALDPVSESTADLKSFAFRRFRSTFDAHSFIVRAFSLPAPPRYALKADVKACYASISHQWLLTNIPINKRFLSEMLNAGHIFRGEFFPPKDIGISLGSSISPIIANMVLDGLQNAIYMGLHGRCYCIDFVDGELIRFADDILVFTRTRESAARARELLTEFLSIRGLVLSDEKTSIVDIEVGFEFLSRHYTRIDGVVRSTPSETAVLKLEKSLSDMIPPYRGGQKRLINVLNHKLIGWANYHKITDAEPTFKRIDALTTALLFTNCRCLHKKMRKNAILKRFFYRNDNATYTYFLVGNPKVNVKRISSTIMIKHQPIVLRMNPYIDIDYFEGREHEKEIRNVSGMYKSIWLRQHGKCHYCGNKILIDEERCVVPIDLAHKPNQNNLVYIHEYCSRDIPEIYETEYDPIESRFDQYSLLRRLRSGVGNFVMGRNICSKFAPLHKYFQACNERTLSLTFEEIEKIIGRPLCRMARTKKHYWRYTYRNTFCLSWQANGYAVTSVNVKRGVVAFEKTLITTDGVSAKIPHVFLYGRIPYAAKVKLDMILTDLRKEFDF